MSGMAVDLFSYLNTNETSRSIYFLGTKQEVLEETVKQFHKNYPKMNIAGYRNGYFIDNDDRKSYYRYNSVKMRFCCHWNGFSIAGTVCSRFEK